MRSFINKLGLAILRYIKTNLDYSRAFMSKGCLFFKRVQKALRIRRIKNDVKFVFDNNEFHLSDELVKKIKASKSITLDELMSL